MWSRVPWMLLGGLLFLAGDWSSHLIAQSALGPAEVPEFDRIVCREIVVTDETGRPQVSIGAGEHGGFVGLSNRAGYVAAALDASDTGGTLVVRAADANSRTVVRADEQGSGLWVLGPESALRFLAVARPNDSELTLYDAQGMPRASMLVRPEGPVLSLLGQDGKGRVAAGVTPDEGGTV